MEAFFLFGWLFIGGFIGYAIGKPKGKGELGAMLGALLGFIGWIIILVIPEGGVKCPECFGTVPIGANKCKHCGSDLRSALKKADEARRAARGNYNAKPAHSMQDAALVKCPCRQCGGSLEFDLQEFDRNNPPTIDCPHCSQPTELFVNRR
jgi:hypothetical protein